MLSYRCRSNVVPIARHFPVASARTTLPDWDADVNVIADHSYGFIMPFMDTSLQSLCTAVMPTFGGCLPDLLVGVLGVQISAGLLHLQRHRVAHRDLKPDNVLIATARVATSSTDAGVAAAGAAAGAGTVAGAGGASAADAADGGAAAAAGVATAGAAGCVGVSTRSGGARRGGRRFAGDGLDFDPLLPVPHNNRDDFQSWRRDACAIAAGRDNCPLIAAVADFGCHVVCNADFECEREPAGAPGYRPPEIDVARAPGVATSYRAAVRSCIVAAPTDAALLPRRKYAT